MAYNVLKGNVQFINSDSGSIESMVDDHSNQTIAGIKTFSQIVTASAGLSASFFYGDGTNLTGITEPAIVTYDGAATNRVIVGSYNNNVVSGAVGLSYDGSSLSVTGDVTASANVSASAFQGDGNSLTNIGPSSLNLGNGLEDSSGLAVKLGSNSGLGLAAGGLSVDVNNLTSRVDPLAGTHTFPFYDTSTTRKTTLSDISTYVADTLTIPSAQGSTTEIQFKNAGDFAASANLTFNSSTNVFTTVTGSFTGDLDVQGNTTLSGTLKVNVDTTGSALITLDKGENDAAEIEFKNNGITVGEIYSNAGESLFIRSVSLGINLRQGTDNVLNIDSSDTTFAHRPITVNQNLTVTGSTTTASRLLNVSSSNTDCTLDLTNEILMMTNTSPATASLPSVDANDVGLTYTIKRTQSGEVEVSGSGTQTIDNSGQTRTLTGAGQYIKIIATQVGANYGWAIIGKSGSF